MTVKRMDNVGIVVEDLDAAIEFFTELGLELEGRAPVEGDWADGVTGLRGMRVEIAMMRTPDGQSRLELSRFLAPPVVDDHRGTPVNALGYLRVMFTVEDLDDTLVRLAKRGATLVGTVAQYGDLYRLCYVRGPEGILIGLAQQLGEQASREDPIGRDRAMATHRGSCHCGRVRFEVDATIDHVRVCDCSIGHRRGALNFRVPKDALRLLGPWEALSVYQWGTRTAKDYFCPVCGILPFRRPSDPTPHELNEGMPPFDGWAVNVRCLEAVDVESLPIRRIHGSRLPRGGA